jgi:hypothetical protein
MPPSEPEALPDAEPDALPEAEPLAEPDAEPLRPEADPVDAEPEDAPEPASWFGVEDVSPHAAERLTAPNVASAPRMSFVGREFDLPNWD